MRHRNKINSLGRKAAHRKKTMSSLATALILNKRINTTIAKAKALRTYVEPLITRSKDDSTHSRRVVFAHLRNKYAVSELFREISQKVADRPGGYTRILKTGFRKGDGAEMCFIELVDYNTNMLKTEEETMQKRTRRGRRRGKKADDQEMVTATAPETEAPTADIAETDTKQTEEDVKTDTAVPQSAEAAPGVTEEVKPADESNDVDEPQAEKQDLPVSDDEQQSPAAEPEQQPTQPEAEKDVPGTDDESQKPADETKTAGGDEQKPEDK